MILVLGSLVAAVMGIGAVFGALNTMYSAVAERAREIATLRALGFGEGSVVLSFVLESLLVALVGGVLGCLAVLPLNGLTTGTMNWQTMSHTCLRLPGDPGPARDRTRLRAGDGARRRPAARHPRRPPHRGLRAARPLSAPPPLTP